MVSAAKEMEIVGERAGQEIGRRMFLVHFVGLGRW